MFSLSAFGLFLTATLTIAFTPGPNAVYVAAVSVSRGRRAGVLAALGIQTGIWVHVVMAVLGLSALIAASETAFKLMKYTGAAYFVFLGVRAVTLKSRDVAVHSAEPAKVKAVFSQGLVVSLLNPLMVIFFLAFLPQFIDPARYVTLQLLLLGLLFGLIEFSAMVAVGLTGGALGSRLRERSAARSLGKWLTALIFIGLGVGTVLTNAG